MISGTYNYYLSHFKTKILSNVNLLTTLIVLYLIHELPYECQRLIC